MIKGLLERFNSIKPQKPKLVKVKIKYSHQFEDIIEEVDINVPIGLSEEDEDKFIDNIVGRDYAYLYGR